MGVCNLTQILAQIGHLILEEEIIVVHETVES